MIKRVLTPIFIFFMLLGVCNLFFLSSFAEGSGSTITLINWDTFGAGSTSGNNGFIAFQKQTGPFIIAPYVIHSSPNSLQFSNGSMSYLGRGWINKTYIPTYENEITVHFLISKTTVADGGVCAWYQSLMFKLANGTNLFQIMFASDWTSLSIQVNGLSGTVLYFYDTGVPGVKSFQGSITIKHTSLNRMNATLYDNAGVKIHSGDLTLFTTYDWHNFSKIHITNAKTGPDYIIMTSYIDDIIVKTSIPPAISGCNDFMEYDNANHIQDIDNTVTYSLSTPYIEMEGFAPVTAKLEGFQLLVNKQQEISDDVLVNYNLYIDNAYVGNPSCFSEYAPNKVMLNWNLSSFSLSTTGYAPVFELVHITTNQFKWYLETFYYTQGPPSLDNIFGMWYNSHVNGIFDYDNINRFYSPNWILYYSQFDDNGTNPNYDNTLEFFDSSGISLPDNPLWNIPFSYVFSTVFISVSVDTVGIYKLYIYDSAMNVVGSEQFFPKELLTYKKIYGWTPLLQGNYTVCIKEGTIFILNKSINITFKDVSFAVWTYPNPSQMDSSFTIGVYAENPSRYTNYAVAVFNGLESINDVSLATTLVYFNDSDFSILGFYYTMSYPIINYGTCYVRLFTNSGGQYIPITAPYLHFVQRFMDLTYIRTSLTDNIGVINTPFNVFGVYTTTVSIAKVFRNNEDIGDVSAGSFTFAQMLTKSGTYVYHLKELQNGIWTDICPSVTVSIREYGGGGETDPILGWLDNLPLFLKVTLGLLITLLITLLPIIVSVLVTKHSLDIPDMVYVGFFFLGLGVSCGIGLLNWALFFVILLGLIVYFVVQQQQNKG